MAFDTKTLPEPPSLPQAIIVDMTYGTGSLSLGCIALAVHQIHQPPHFPLTECVYAVVIDQQLTKGTFSTSYYLVPLQFVTNVELANAPEAKYESPTQMLVIAPDKPAPSNRLPEARIKSLLYEFGAQI